MELTFLEATVPLAKSFDKNHVVKAYPLVKQLTSHVVQVDTLNQFANALRTHGQKGYALLKGSLVRPIFTESRAGLTNTQTLAQYVVIDVDHGNFSSPEDVVQALPKYFHDCSYVAHLSSSYKITKQNYAGHLYFQLDRPRSADELKEIIKDINLTHFRDSLTLNSIGTALLWPIDPSVNEASRLIYISPPVCTGFEDPVADRTSVVVKNNQSVKLPEPGPTKHKVTRVVNQLRDEMGLGKFKGQIREFQGEQILTNTGAAESYQCRADRGFVYFNINGGDSWGYYHPADNPDIIYNFKGEPNYLTRELLPEYYKGVTGVDEPENQRSYLAFRHFASDQYFNGWYDSKTDRYTVAPTASAQKIHHFLKQHGQPVSDFIEDWDYEFDFSSKRTIDFDARWLNKYQPTDFLRNTGPYTGDVPPLCAKVIRHVCGGEEEYIRFINWLAAVLQYRRITKTAWIFNGVEGTGKGIMFHHILSPIVGAQHCVTKTIESMEDSFNGYLEGCVFLMLDEFRVTDSRKTKSIVASIKNLIVEPVISVRHMRQTARMVRNFVNLIIASNERDPMLLAPSDRRFNVGVYQALRINISNKDIESLSAELQDFASYLLNYPINNAWLATPLENESRAKLQALTQTTIDECIVAISSGNYNYFLELLPIDESKHVNPDVMEYKRTLIDLFTQYQTDEVVTVTRDQLRDLFHYAAGNMPIMPGKFTKLIKHRGLDITPVAIGDGRSVRGIKTKLVDVDPILTAQALDLGVKKLRRVK